MHPFLIDTFLMGHHIKVPTFGVLLATAFSTAYFLSLKNAVQVKIAPKHIERLFLLILIASALGARLFHVVFEDPSFYLKHPEKIIAVWEGGFTFYGSFLASLLTVYLYSKYFSLNLGTVCDIAGTSTFLSLAIGRLGCFAAGCCWGKPCSLPWAVTFLHPEAFNSVHGIPVHPSQLYEAGGSFLVFLWCQHHLSRKHFPGEVGLKGLMGYALVRFFVEYFRGDSYRGFIVRGLLSYSQTISIILIIGALLGLALFKKKSHLSN